MQITNEIIVQKAKSIGFDLVGFAKADALKEEINHLEEWLVKGYQAEMSYMENNVDKRTDVSNILQNAKSVISLGLNYYHAIEFSGKPGTGKVSRYAWGKDYHLIIWE